jgi:hypothetical protein
MLVSLYLLQGIESLVVYIRAESLYKHVNYAFLYRERPANNEMRYCTI